MKEHLLAEDLPYEVTQEKQQEIEQLEFVPLTRVRNNPTGKKFNRLFVLGRAPSAKAGKNPISMWWCICDCEEHNIIQVRINNLTSNNTKSCGCLDKETSSKKLKDVNEALRKRLEGEIIENFLVLNSTDERRYNSIVWRCECLLCGNKNYYATTNTLLNHTPKSCGCENRSRGIIKIDNILDKNNIIYQKEKTFEDCRFIDTLASARFDYYIKNNKEEYIIEYDGEQHFKQLDSNFFRNSLEEIQAHDQFKNRWCLEHNIPLYRIPYYELDNVNNLEDIWRYRV